MEINNSEINKISLENLGSTIEETFNIYKRTALINGLFFMILVVVLAILTIIGLNYFFNVNDLSEQLKGFKPENLTISQLLVFVGVSLAINVLIIPFVAGMLKVNEEADLKQTANFSTIVSLVNSPVYIQLVLGIIVTTLITSILNYGYILLGLSSNLKILFTILSSVFGLFSFFTIPLIIFKNRNVLKAIQLSFKATSKNLIFVVITVFLGIIAACLGIFALCIGIFFTAPIFYTVQYVLYKRIFENEILKA